MDKFAKYKYMGELIDLLEDIHQEYLKGEFETPEFYDKDDPYEMLIDFRLTDAYYIYRIKELGVKLYSDFSKYIPNQKFSNSEFYLLEAKYKEKLFDVHVDLKYEEVELLFAYLMNNIDYLVLEITIINGTMKRIYKRLHEGDGKYGSNV